MSKKLSSEFQDYLFSKYPNIYRVQDGNRLLEKFTYALTDPAVPLIEKVERMYELLSADDCPDEVVHIFYSNFGGEFYDGIALDYQRKFLLNAMGVIRRRGTFECVRYLVSATTGLMVDLKYLENGIDENGWRKRILRVTLLAKTLEDTRNMDTSIAVVTELLKGQLPFYLTVNIDTRIDTQILQSKSYSHSAIGSYKFYNIRRMEEVH